MFGVTLLYTLLVSLFLIEVSVVVGTLQLKYGDSHRFAVYYDDSLSYTWHEAEAKCESIGSTLATITDFSDEFDAQDIRIDESIDTWIGYNDILNEGDWQWIDERDFDYNNWNQGTYEPNGKYYENCAVIAGTYRNFDNRWVDVSCNAKIRQWICNYPIIKKSNDNKYVCIFDSIGGFTFDIAENYCKQVFHSNLASIHSNDDNTRFFNTRAKIISTAFGLKYKFKDEENILYYTDGTSYDYTRFTNNDIDASNEFETCFFYNPYNADWADTSCDTQFYQFMCNLY